ncbi:MAG TPA: hypothetical protein VHM25_00920 [Polyangiaceae bacterium]|jgi:hypothetical protein|nr:hypothetical protein [Polyangiaceae bacterium]
MRKSTSFTRLTTRWLFIGAALAALASTRTAGAQNVHQDRVQHEVFDDDLLNADLGAPFGVQVFPRVRGRHVLLIRPRTSFVPELYKSIEHI